MRRLIAILLLGGVARADSDDDMGRRVQQLLRAHQADVFSCVTKDEQIGEALLRVVVGTDVPRSTEVLKADAAVQKPAECVAAAARSWNLAALGAAAGDQVVFPLAFAPETPGVANTAVRARIEIERLSANKKRSSSTIARHGTACYVIDGTPDWRQNYVRFHERLGPGDVVYAPDGDCALVADKGPVTIAKVIATVRGSDADTVKHVGDAATYPIPGANVRLYLDGVAAPFAVDKLCAKKGTKIPKHTHDSDELVYVLSGQAKTTLGESTIDTHASSIITIPAHTPHALAIEADLCAVQVYAPAGPEQRFKVQPRTP